MPAGQPEPWPEQHRLCGMRVAVVGAGPSGLAAARAFRELGLDVVVFEAAPDIGGVWSATRRYPGIATQNDKHTYAYSDRRMDDGYADAPAGADVRAYLQGFARENRLEELIRLDTRVAEAEPVDGGWTFETHGPHGIGRETVDWLVVANGLCSMPYLPAIAGREEFEAAGGRLLVPSQIGDAEALQGRDVVVIGWGKSAADIAVAAAPVARSVTIVARRIGWKVPRSIGRLSFQRVMLSRVGEHLLWGPYRTLRGRVLRRLTRVVRVRVVSRLGKAVTRQLELDRRGLVPDVPADQLDHLVTDGLLEAIDDGRIVVRRDTRIARLSGGSGTYAELTDGVRLPADVVVAATGYDQDLGLFSDAARRALVDEHGDLALVRYALPEGVPNLAFVGWVNSFRSLIGAEMQSLWVAAVMLGLMRVPDEARHEPPVFRLSHDSAAKRSLPQLPENGSFLTVDTWLRDLGLTPSAWRRRGEIFGPMAPEAYADLLGSLRDRLSRSGTRFLAASDIPAPRPPRATVSVE
ncbi:MAG: monooxygenase [Frankiales bacterium]|nr:monooxygenase [Frankiales bacterium]